MEIRNITTFVRVAELQSFSRAAEQLGYSQSAVTVQIRQLEQELGLLLFERIGKQVRLTENGSRFVLRALDILNAVDAAKNMAYEPERVFGKLRIATAESLLISVLPPVIMKFRQRCPEVEIITYTGVIGELFDMVRQNDVDLLFFLDKKTYHSEWVKVTERLEPIVFAASAEHPLAAQKNISLERVLEEPFLLTEKGISYRYDLEQNLAARNMEIHPFLETGNTDVITNLLLHNAGISFLPKYVIDQFVRQGRLVLLDVDVPQIQMWSQLVYHKNKWITPQMKVFIELMDEMQRGERCD
ncbi:MAG: LysR family transcriptional regulator [Lachnospiraceae bacterium]|nr:LysR family transcriptional regulator [Lachnospiraceae bacterium]